MARKIGILIIAALVTIVSLLSACGGSQTGSTTKSPGITAAPPRGTTGTISIGTVIESSPIPVTPQGGSFTLNQPDSPINGMVLGVPPGAYANNLEFKISYAPINKHTFGENFNPLTPLIKIDNGGGLAAEIMEVTIPVKVPADSFAMGFIYDEKTNTLEGLPTLAQDANSITVGTRHFTDIVISYIAESLLKKDIDSGFRPGIDDWQFTNYGSYIAKGGHCTGQSMTSMWYYEVQPDGKGLTLYGRYDNNGDKPATPALWQDDSLGYRLASTTQMDMDWDSWGRKISLDYVSYSDDITRKMFAYAMQITHEPQMVEIWNTPVGGGHAMVVYRAVGGTLYIADPNYPGNTERRIEYANGKFAPYESGANKEEIDKGNTKSYDQIVYVAKSSLLDWDKEAARWAEFKAKTIGDDRFPAYTIAYKETEENYPELPDGFISPNKLIRIAAISNTPNFGCYVFRDGVLLKFDPQYNIELVPGENKLGILIVCTVDAEDKNGNPIKVDKYVDFKYLTVTFKSDDAKISIDPPTLEGQEKQLYTFNLVNPENIKYVRLDWLMDGVLSAPASTPKYEALFSPGDHIVTVNLYDLSHNLLGTAESTIHIDALIVSNLPKLQQIKSIKGGFSGKNTYSNWNPTATTTGTSFGSISIPSMPITWSGPSFSGKTVFEDNNIPSTDEINGTVSADGNTLLTLTFSHQDYNYYGYGKSNPDYSLYTRSLQFKDIPLNSPGDDFGIGKLYGADSQKGIVKMEYQVTTFKNNVKVGEQTYVSTDWTATGIGATPEIGIYFGR